MNIDQCISYDKLQEEIENDDNYYYGELHINSVDGLLSFLQRVETTLSELKSIKYTKEQFDNVVCANDYVYYFEHDKTVKLDGEFTPESLRIIAYAMDNHPEWFEPCDES